MSYEIAYPGLNGYSGLGNVDLSQDPPECAGQDPSNLNEACQLALAAQLAAVIQGAENSGWTKVAKPAQTSPAFNLATGRATLAVSRPVARLNIPTPAPYESTDVPGCSGLPPDYRGNCLLPNGQPISACNGSTTPCWSTLSGKILGSSGPMPSPPKTTPPVQIDGATGCAAGGLLGAMGGGLLLGVPLALGAAILGAVMGDEGQWWKWGGLTFVGATVLSGIAGCAGGVNAVDDAYKTGRLPAGA